MRTRALVTTTLFVALQSGAGIAVSHAADLIWEVENPYRIHQLFLFSRSFNYLALGLTI